MFANLEIHTLEEEMSNTFAIMINNESSMRICFIQYTTEFSSLCFRFEKFNTVPSVVYLLDFIPQSSQGSSLYRDQNSRVLDLVSCGLKAQARRYCPNE
jgi:hypothetical protein